MILVNFIEAKIKELWQKNQLLRGQKRNQNIVPK
jgi:hypothetical protein